MRGAWLLAACVAIGCAGQGNAVPPAEATTTVETARLRTFCAVSLAAPEAFATTLHADDVRGVDCVPPERGERFSLGFAHAGWWLQLDVARASLAVGAPHAFDGQATLLALDCWDWNGAVTVEADDDAGWTVAFDARCNNDASKAIVGRFEGEY
jgi:hypothetical protein